MSSEEIHIKLNYISKIVGNQLQFEWTTIKVQVCKHLEHWSLKMVLLYNDKTAVDVPDCKMMTILVGSELLDRYCSTIARYASRPSSKVSEKSDFLFQRPWFGAIQHQVLWKSESAVHVGRPPALKLKNWKTEKQKKSQIPWKQGLTLHTKAYRRWYLSATTHKALTKRSLSVHITEIVRATNSVLDRTEINIYELNELDSSVRSNAIRGFRLKWLFFQKHQHKRREVKLSATSSSSAGLP